MNWKAWDNNAAAYGLPFQAFVGFKGLWEITATCDKRFGVRPHVSSFSTLRGCGGARAARMKEGCSGEKVLARER
jgi:hypothetical protein